MASNEYPFIIGTAGHIDHGKTALVKALTGVDCDRLAEEKKRGMTIELGFAPFTLPSGKTVSIIDVPGHEKFIKHMAAGAAGIDAVMLVVAADDGVMPQTREHLAILSLLGIKNGLTVINKSDAVDEEMLEMAIEDTRALLAGTFLEDKPIIPVSALTGSGIEVLKAALQKMADAAETRSAKGSFFLPVDRVFHIAGFGTVVTGTAISGEIKIGDEIEIMPRRAESKVRSLQVHGANVESASAGQRVAINLANTSLEEVKRGDVITARGTSSASECLDVKIKLIESAQPLKHWQRLHLHTGTAETPVRLSLLDRTQVQPGETVIAQLIAETPVVASRGSRFILRTYSPLSTAAGGTILTPSGERPKNKEAKASLIKCLEILAAEPPLKERLLAIVNHKGKIAAEEAARMNEITPTELMRALSPLEAKSEIAVIRTGETEILSKDKIAQIARVLTNRLAEFHKEHPEREGMPLEETTNALAFRDTKYTREVLQILEKQGTIKVKDDRASLPGFEPFDEERFAANASALKKFASDRGFSMPTIDEARESLGLTAEEIKRIISFLKEKKELTLLTGALILLPETESDFIEKVKQIPGEITLAAVRDAAGSTRKYTLPLLEHLDTKGITRRVGEKRILVKK